MRLVGWGKEHKSKPIRGRVGRVHSFANRGKKRYKWRDTDDSQIRRQRWKSVWCIWHTKVETLQEFWSHRQIGWIIQDFWETCVAFFNVLPRNKDSVVPKSLTKEESLRVYNCDGECLSGQINAGFSKVCEIFKVCGIESIIILIFYGCIF